MLELVNTLPHVTSGNPLPDCPGSLTNVRTTKFRSTELMCQCEVSLSKHNHATFTFNIDFEREASGKDVCLLHAGGRRNTWSNPDDNKCVRHIVSPSSFVNRCGTHLCVRAWFDDTRLAEVQLQGTVNL